MLSQIQIRYKITNAVYKQTKPKTHLQVPVIGLGLGLDFQAIELELDFQELSLFLMRVLVPS